MAFFFFEEKVLGLQGPYLLVEFALRVSLDQHSWVWLGFAVWGIEKIRERREFLKERHL